jgi:hypothetical protein
MTAKTDVYRQYLASTPDWEDYLLRESCLPGPRSNLELLAVAAEMGEPKRLRAYLGLTPEQAPGDDPHVFLVTVALLNLGHILAKGDLSPLADVRRMANDPRWRVREVVAMTLSLWGEADMPALLEKMSIWARGTLLEQRAAAAGLCEPRLLHQPAYARRTLAILDAITASIPACSVRRSEEFKALRKGLGYCWSVAVAALPAEGVPILRKWLASPDADIQWIMRENLKKNRLIKLNLKLD